MVSGLPIQLPSGEKLLASAPTSGDLDGRTLLAALLVASTQPSAVLDVGCKSGWLLAYLSREGGASTLVGVDRDATHLPGLSGRVVVGDARRLPVATERFDAVTMFDVIEHLPEGSEPEALAEAARVLCPRGLLFVSTPADWLPGTLLAETRGRWSDVLGLPLLYASTRLGLPMPARSWFRRRANREYARAGRYTHFVVACKP
jgi:SAM-dependent methyltransferase